MNQSAPVLPVASTPDARQALAQFLTPPAPRLLSDAEQLLADQATSLSIPFHAIHLQGWLWGNKSSVTSTTPTVMLIHGWGSYGLQLSDFVEPLLVAGYQVLTFDAPAHGRTPGIQTNGFELAQAIATVANYYTATFGQPIYGMIAHSLGAASTTLALSEGLRTTKVVYLGAICWLSNALTVFAKRARLTSEMETALRHLFMEQFGEDVWLRYAADHNAQNLNVPITLFHDRRDRDVSFAESVAIAQVWPGAQLVETVGLGHRRILRDAAVIKQTVDFMAIQE
jgi:pimeloyl-ACP methyl ester carboxylesterase